MKTINVIVLCGGASSSEREVSLISGELVYQECKKLFPTTKIVLEEDALPPEVAKQKNAVILPVTPGEFGEDGQLQVLLKAAGLTFIGSEASASMIGMNKHLAKQVFESAGIPIAKGMKVSQKNMPSAATIIKTLGTSLVIKPNSQGSSIGILKTSSENDLNITINTLSPNKEYLIEERLIGNDLSVGILDGRALEVIEIKHKNDFFSFDEKYVPGVARKICPAQIPNETTAKVKKFAEAAFKACGCRDHARADFILGKDGSLHILEINTLPGIRQTSLFSISAAGAGIEYDNLLKILVGFAANRLHKSD